MDQLRRKLESVKASQEDMWALWQAAADLCLATTSVSAAYVANVSAEDAEEPPVPEVTPTLIH